VGRPTYRNDLNSRQVPVQALLGRACGLDASLQLEKYLTALAFARPLQLDFHFGTR